MLPKFKLYNKYPGLECCDIDFGANTSGSLTWNYSYPVHCGTTTVFNADGGNGTTSYIVDSNNKAFTIKAAPAPWAWTTHYTNNVLKKGVPVSEFKYGEWNRLMHCLDTWYKYAGKGNAIAGTFMTKDDRTLTATRYNNAYAGLNAVFDVDNDITSSAIKNSTVVSASSLKKFGETMNYGNYDPS